MDIWKHCLLSQRKFGGEPQDYVAVHRFMDSSKLFYYHARHRLLLHHTLGLEWATQLLGDLLTTSAGRTVLVRDVAAEHCKEDLLGRVPSLGDWLREADAALAPLVPALEALPAMLSVPLRQLVLAPYLRTGLPSALLITASNFGVHLAGQLLGLAAAEELATALRPLPDVAQLLQHFTFAHPWQYRPDPKELAWLRQQEHRRYELSTTHAPAGPAAASPLAHPQVHGIPTNQTAPV
ncbi:hypothetical protein EJV47_10925 [Hymenobacter gummosus]|uniref:DUF6915 domain-containing protein n=1 Tax=Hymenobacter gummosus TaxID=1776032 RepID=A0A3S0JHL1_9BACT|nr:hypothetical protein [Hymenobacter gummosus]RTQ50140.1 hypothetical protein EJV47_10925 [Hymenobacter gummosus]